MSRKKSLTQDELMFLAIGLERHASSAVSNDSHFVIDNPGELVQMLADYRRLRDLERPPEGIPASRDDHGDLHRAAQSHSEAAEQAMRMAARNYTSALPLEREAASLVPDGKPRTKAILTESAAAIKYKLELLRSMLR